MFARRLLGRQSTGGVRAFHASARSRADVTLTIDGKQVTVPQGTALIQACEKAGAHIPRYCYHEKLQIAGNCRMCLVEMERAPKPVASCAMPAMPNMNIKTNTPLVHKAREGVTEMLLQNHPLDCPICDQGGECDLQDQSMRYGSDRGRFHEMKGKRAVEDKNIGPLIKTVMTRCIHCTRCVRFANEVAGAPELGTSGRGNDMQIGTYIETALKSEMSGNVIDLCPVGALTSKPYAFRARPWELKRTESVDVHDALGANIRVDSRGMEVLRVLPRLNDEINEEWIDDKSRFACDGQNLQRLTTPLIKEGDAFHTATWDQALTAIADAYKRLAPKGNEFKFVSGHLTDVETLVAAKDLASKLNSDNLALDQPRGSEATPHGVDVRSNYLFNTTIHGVEDADFILLVGTNPRHEAAVLNARIRKTWLAKDDIEIAVCGESQVPLTYDYTYVGNDAVSLKKALSGQVGSRLAAAKKPLVIVGSAVSENADAKAYYELVTNFVHRNSAKFFQEEGWQGFSVLQRAASRAGAYDVGFVAPTAEMAAVKPKMVWLLGADEITPADLPKDAFVVYQGHHGDIGAQLADVVLPGATAYEKSATYVNTEGRAQTTHAATNPPGVARDDWKIVRAVSEYLGQPLPYDDIFALRSRVAEYAPSLVRYDVVEPASMSAMGVKQMLDSCKGSTPSNAILEFPIKDFYLTNAIARASRTMGRCSVQYTKGGSQDLKPEVAYG